MHVIHEDGWQVKKLTVINRKGVCKYWVWPCSVNILSLNLLQRQETTNCTCQIQIKFSESLFCSTL